MTDDVSQPGKAFSLSMTLEDPTKVAELRAWLSLDSTKALFQVGLKNISTLHYARFLPLEALGQILFVAEYDGSAENFVEALASEIGGPLSTLLEGMKKKPTLPVDQHLDEFKAYVTKSHGVDTSPFSAYEGKSVQAVLDTEPGPCAGKAPPLPETGKVTDPTTASRVNGAFSLLMRLEDPKKLPELLSRLADPYTKGRIDAALESLDYVHYARFLPLIDCGALMIITEFDGIMRDYVMDFAAALDREFSMILAYMKDRPMLPVSAYPAEFWGYVSSNLVKDTGLYSAYPAKTVLDIVGATKRKDPPARPKVPEAEVRLADIQGNILKGFRPAKTYHYYLKFPSGAEGRSFVAKFPVSHADGKPGDGSVCFNIGLTYDGFQALELPAPILEAFPEAYRAGPAARADHTGDAGDDALAEWSIGGPSSPVIHAVVSVHCRTGANENVARQAVEDLIQSCKLQPQLCMAGNQYAIVAEAFADAPNEIHFGYRDGISQPRIGGIPDLPIKEEANAFPGDFLLGHDYVNSRGGRYIGKLIEPLAKNGTYAAFRIIEQKVASFEQWLEKTAPAVGLSADELAAKLMGRFKDGTPLAKYTSASNAPVDDFDYANQKGSAEDDPRGLRCPLGAHIRRLNPRAGLVLGVPWGRLLLRRGLPFGPRYDPKSPDDKVSRGLVGVFICGDLEAQFEFLLNVWGRKDLSAYGLRGTQDPFTAHAPTTHFQFLDKDGNCRDMKVDRLTRTLGSLYLFMPGVTALQWIGSGMWLQGESAELAERFRQVAARLQAPAQPAPGGGLNPTLPAFRDDPYPFYLKARNAPGVQRVGFKHDSYWVFSHDLVTQVCERKDVFLKPGKNHLPSPRPFGIAGNTPDGLFFMDPPRHTEVRPALDKVFQAAIAPVIQALQGQVDSVIGSLSKQPTLEVVKGFAGRIAPWAFMEAFGIPTGPALPPTLPPNFERLMVENWTRAMLDGHDPNLPPLPPLGVIGGTSALALRAYLSSLNREQAASGSGCPVHIASGLHQLSCPGTLPKPLNDDEVVNTASHFALGGYLSTEFLLITGIYNLLHHNQWKELHDNPKLIGNAVWEMLRYDAPFQMADRWVDQDTDLGGVRIEANSKVTVVYGSANRDAAVFADPDRFDIQRTASPDKTYGFGHGIHRCIGEVLALEIASTAIGALVAAFPNAQLLGPPGEWLPDPYFRSLRSLRIALR